MAHPRIPECQKLLQMYHSIQSSKLTSRYTRRAQRHAHRARLQACKNASYGCIHGRLSDQGTVWVWRGARRHTGMSTAAENAATVTAFQHADAPVLQTRQAQRSQGLDRLQGSLASVQERKLRMDASRLVSDRPIPARIECGALGHIYRNVRVS